MLFGTALFDPETVVLLGKVVDRVWDFLPRELRSLEARHVIAKAILPLAADGERDEARLRDYALTVVPALLRAQHSFGLTQFAAADDKRRSPLASAVTWLRAAPGRAGSRNGALG